MTDYNTAEVVRFLLETWDRVDKLELSDEAAFSAVTNAVADRYPGLSIEQYKQVLDVFDEEVEHDAEEINRAYDASRRRSDEAYLIFAGLPPDTKFAEACRLKADATGPDGEAARRWLTYWASPEHRRYEALLDAAIAAHPGWHTTAEAGVYRVDDGVPEGVDLIEWFQRSHPHEAALIENQFEARSAGLP